MLILKLKTKDGQHVVKDLTVDTTLKHLKEVIEQLTQIPRDLLSLKLGNEKKIISHKEFFTDFSIVSGFPPKPIEIADEEQTLNNSGIKHGDILIVEEKQMSQEEKEAQEREKRVAEDERLAKELAIQNSSESVVKGVLLKKVVPADNSCLFTSIGKCLHKPTKFL